LRLSTQGVADDDVLDEALHRLHATGPEFDGYLSNHGPMAADALVRMGRVDAVEQWVTGYLPRLHEAPTPRWGLTEGDAPQALGVCDRVGDWCALFDRLLREEQWTEVLSRWWPRLLPSAVTAAAHPLIRTGHVVRALRERETDVRVRELAQALGYWAARWQPLNVGSALGVPLRQLPIVTVTGTFQQRLEQLGAIPGGTADLEALVDEAVAGYLLWGADNPVMLVHAATAPRAAALVLPSLPEQLWPATRAMAWSVSCAVVTAYRTGTGRLATDRAYDDVVDRAVATGDEHAIKFLEVALESVARGSPTAGAAAALAVDLLA
jgi:hypothetical protein